jgi:hypothetical protein
MEAHMAGRILRSLIPLFLYVVPEYPVFAQVSFFQPPTFQGTGHIIVADFNGDSKPDVLTSDGTLQLGTGGGAFASPTTIPGTPLLVADFNGDGIPDILEQGTNTLLVLLGNGDGTFQPAISNTGGASIVVAANLNGDNSADVVGVSGTSLLIFISKGDGTLAAPVAYNLGANGSAVSFGDFNGDGKMDLAVAATSGEEIVFLGNGDGTFKTPGITSSTGSAIDFAAVGDFNGDGKLDLAVSEPSCGTTCPAVYILPGNGNGTFGAPVLAFAGDGPLVAADVNGDGKLDLLSAPQGFVQIFVGNGDGTFSNASIYAALPYFYTFNNAYVAVSVGVAVADFNNDGKLDIALGGGAILFGIGDGSFQGVSLVPAPSGSAVAGSFGKNHGRAIAALSGAQLSILAMNGAYRLALTHTYALPHSGTGIVAADFNGDGNIDLVVVGSDSSNKNWNYSVLLGNADGSFQSPILSQQSGSLTGSIAVGDFNNDNKPDLVVGVGGQKQLAVLLGNGDGTFASPSYSQGFQTSLIADFNGDGNLDIAANQGTSTVISYGNGDGTFQPPVSPPSLDGFIASFTGDVNNDGKADLIAGGCEDCSHFVELGNGDGTFTPVCCIPPTGLSGAYNILFIADFNGDGNIDFLGANANTFAPFVSMGNGDGTFGSGGGFLPGFYGEFGVANPLWPFLAADVSGDGIPDIICLGPDSGLAVMLNMTAAPADFSIGVGAGSTTFRTVSAGQTASFTLVLAPLGSFTGVVNLSCAITPAATPAPTCALSSVSVQIGGIGTQTVTVKVGTTASVTSSTVPHFTFPPGPMPFAWFLMFLGSLWMWARNRKRLPVFAAPLVVLAFVFLFGCGVSNSSSSTHTTSGTPAGTYTAIVTAISGSTSHNMALQVVVQ